MDNALKAKLIENVGGPVRVTALAGPTDGTCKVGSIGTLKRLHLGPTSPDSILGVIALVEFERGQTWSFHLDAMDGIEVVE